MATTARYDRATSGGPVSGIPRRRVTGLAPLTMRLTGARFRTRSGESLLYGAAILAATMSAAIAFTVAGGTWMFAQRAAHPTGLLAQVVAEDDKFGLILNFYVGLAAIACALLIPSLVSLSAAGAQLGARGRERRLASLRLLGLSSGDVTRMALLDALVQVLSGTVLGYFVYLVTLPAWGHVTFEAVPVRPTEMMLPWWLAFAVGAALAVLSLASAAWGLRQVRISPLGVARRANRPAARIWRLVVFGVLVMAAVVVTPMLRLSVGNNAVFLLLGGVLIVVLVGIQIVGPWLVQLLARMVARSPWPALTSAGRRIQANPVRTWSRVASIGALAFTGGYLASMPFSYDPANAGSAAQGSFMALAQRDFTTGAMITLAAGFTLTAVALLITQASATIERGEQSRALHKVGFPNGFALRVMWLETFGPLLLSTLLGAVLGLAMAAPMAEQIRRSGLPQNEAPWPMLAVLVGGLVVAALGLVASHPLHRQQLGIERRRND